LELTVIPHIPILDPMRHKEDTVREEVISPILKALGYKLEGEHRIERSPRLKHPYVMLGSRRNQITLVPDYLLYRFGKPFCVLDAKAPNEDVYAGDHVQQVFGYAIHPEVRVQYFALCNGADFAIHHVSAEKPVMRIPLQHLNGHWSNLVKLIGTDGMQNDLLTDDFLLDFGVFSEKFRLNKDIDGKNVTQFFPFIHFANLRRSSDDLYDSQTVFDLGDEQELFLTLAFDAERYAQLLKILPQEVSIQLADAMKRYPYHCALTTEEPIYVSLAGILSDRLYTSTTHQFDQYRPLIVTEVFGDSSHDVKHML
jgi:Type I restriction enzyme R protein N terminus (HSDR_N)